MAVRGNAGRHTRTEATNARSNDRKTNEYMSSGFGIADRQRTSTETHHARKQKQEGSDQLGKGGGASHALPTTPYQAAALLRPRFPIPLHNNMTSSMCVIWCAPPPKIDMEKSSKGAHIFSLVVKGCTKATKFCGWAAHV